MNDFEERLCRTPLRMPPPEWRDEMAAKGPVHRSWRQEVSPSISAWAALAAVWLLLLAIERLTVPADAEQGRSASLAIEPPSSDSFRAYHAALNSANTHNRPY